MDTIQMLVCKLEEVNELIEEWKPDTAWDAADQRSLVWLKMRRRRYEKALERLGYDETGEKISRDRQGRDDGGSERGTDWSSQL